MQKFSRPSSTLVLGALMTASAWSCGGNSKNDSNGVGATANSSGSGPSGGSSGNGGDSGSSGGASASGGAESGGTGSGGTSTAGAGGNPSGGSSGTSSGEVATLGDPCSAPGALACAGNHQKLTLLCGAGETWEANETCGDRQLCDSTPGPNVGSCRDAIESCDAPGDTFCEGDDLWECGPDTVTSELVEACGAGCKEGACLPGPGPGDDPCPESPALADCSMQCGADHEDCADAVCGKQGIIDLTGITLEPGMILARTPVASAASCACEDLEPPVEERFGVFVRMRSHKTQTILRVNVQEPWHVAARNHAIPEVYCSTSIVENSQCRIAGHPQSDPENTSDWFFWTSDPKCRVSQRRDFRG